MLHLCRTWRVSFSLNHRHSDRITCFYALSHNCEKWLLDLSVCPHGTSRLPLDGLSYLIIFRKSVGKIKVLLKSVKSDERFTLTPMYRGADKSLVRPWKETSYSEQDLQHYTKISGVQTTGIYSWLMAYKQEYIPDLWRTNNTNIFLTYGVQTTRIYSWLMAYKHVYIPDLWRTNNRNIFLTYGVQTGIYSWLVAYKQHEYTPGLWRTKTRIHSWLMAYKHVYIPDLWRTNNMNIFLTYGVQTGIYSWLIAYKLIAYKRRMS